MNIIGERVAPWLLGRYLARSANGPRAPRSLSTDVSAQQNDQDRPVTASRLGGRRQWAALAAAGFCTGMVRARQRVGLPAAVSTGCAFAVPATLAAGFRRSPVRDAAVWSVQMWAYKNAFEMPNDHEKRLQRRAHLDYTITVDTCLGAGVPPGQRLQRRLRQRGQLTALAWIVGGGVVH
jgi:hypothetical protein